uniref:Uncharacterized protein n=1 Tax=Caenorhabditis japonica TaxID=281687 RepID=A0A8R1ISI7_CAEJA
MLSFLRRFLVFIVLLTSTVLPSVLCLSQNELNELSRKFKYYHPAVRPAAPDNFVSGRNGTFFNIPVELHVLATRIINTKNEEIRNNNNNNDRVQPAGCQNRKE